MKGVDGYNLRDQFIGSEGTLGVVTQVLLRLLPKPAARQTLLATFARIDAAAETVSAIIAAKVIPCTLAFLDRKTIRCVEDCAKVGLPLDAEAILLIETDGHPESVFVGGGDLTHVAFGKAPVAFQKHGVMAGEVEASIALLGFVPVERLKRGYGDLVAQGSGGLEMVPNGVVDEVHLRPRSAPPPAFARHAQ